ncbi:hypothetical protein Lser_V15G12647 [Lactuca serriola]
MADKRQWTQEEEDALITILQDIVVISGKGDNGSFRPGTYDQVVLKLREKVVGINITAKHVQNKIKRLKDKFSAAYDMQNTSGFGWDDVRKCVVVDSPEILEEYLKKHPHKNYVANKPFPAYERLANVFGKDRATGGMAESAADVTQNQNIDNEEGESLPSSNSNPQNTATSSNPNPKDSSQNKKRKAASEEVTYIIGKGLVVVSEEIQKMTRAITSSTNDLTGLKTIHEELKTKELSSSEIMRVCLKFTKNLNLLPMWNSLDAATKPLFAKTILEEDN